MTPQVYISWPASSPPPPTIAAPVGAGHPSGVGPNSIGTRFPEFSFPDVNTPSVQGVTWSQLKCEWLWLSTVPSVTGSYSTPWPPELVNPTSG